MKGAGFRLRLVYAAAVTLLAAGCQPPLGLGSPSTRSIEADATAALGTPFEMSGSYGDAGGVSTLDVRVGAEGRMSIAIRGAGPALDAVVMGPVAYFRGRDFVAARLGGDAGGAPVVAAVGDSWWKGAATDAPRFPHFTTPDGFRTAFLGPSVTSRRDNLKTDGVDVIELSGPVADLFVEAGGGHRPVRLRMQRGAAVDGLTGADLHYRGFGAGVAVPEPAPVVDFANMSSLPPLYTVLSVDTSRCATPCVVTAVVKNLGSTQRARAPSEVRFVATDRATRTVAGSCVATVTPDVGFNATTTVSCAIAGIDGTRVNALDVTATPDNPGAG